MKSELIHLPALDYYALVNFFGSQNHLDDVPLEKLLGEAICFLSKSVKIADLPKAHHGLFSRHTLISLVIDASFVSTIEANLGVNLEDPSEDIERLAYYFAKLPDYRKMEVMKDGSLSNQAVSAK